MKKAILAVIFLSAMTGAHAQVLSYQSFIDSVRRHNSSMFLHQSRVAEAQAEIAAARATDDPTLSLEYGNNSDWYMLMGQSASVEISKPLAPGKRRARVAVAREAMHVAVAEYDDFWRNLRADASIDFYGALLAKEMLLIGTQAYQNIESLAQSDSLRFAKGEISELDMIQSRLEQRRAQQELNRRRTDFLNALVVLDERLCTADAGGTRDVEGQLSAPGRLFDLRALRLKAAESRADLCAAANAVTLSQSEERLALRERRSDVELALGASYNTQVLNDEAPAPQFVGYTVGLSLPLPVTSVNRGVRNAAKSRVQQAGYEWSALRAQVDAEVVRAYNTYRAALSRAEAYADNMMSQARQVLDGKLYAYQRGDTSLLEVLMAQETFNEIREEYATSLYDCMVALAELERSVGEL